MPTSINAQSLSRSLEKEAYESATKKWFTQLFDFMHNHLDQLRILPAFKSLMSYQPTIRSGDYTIGMYRGCAKFVSKPALLQFYFNQLPPAHQSLLTHLTWVGYASYEQVKAICGQQLLMWSPGKDNGVQINPYFKDLTAFVELPRYLWQNKLTPAEIRHQTAFFLPPLLRQAFSTILPPPNDGKLPLTGQDPLWQVYDFEQAFFDEYPSLLLALRKQLIKTTSSDFIHIPSAKAEQRLLKLKSFPGDPGHAKALLLSSFIPDGTKWQEQPAILKHLDYIFRQQKPTLAMIDAVLYPISGIRKVPYYELQLTAFTQAMHLLTKLPAISDQQWVSTPDLQRYAACHYLTELELFGDYTVSVLQIPKQYPQAARFNGAATAIKKGVIRELLIQGTLLLGAVFGLIE